MKNMEQEETKIAFTFNFGVECLFIEKRNKISNKGSKYRSGIKCEDGLVY